jgi:hypothetical protein
MLRHIIPTWLILVVLAGPAAAQALIPTGPRGPSREQIEKERREESAARRAMEEVPDRRPASKDTWGNVRPAPQQPSGSVKKSH